MFSFLSIIVLNDSYTYFKHFNNFRRNKDDKSLVFTDKPSDNVWQILKVAGSCAPNKYLEGKGVQ